MFSMHDVIVTGYGLDALLADFAEQVVTVLHQPPRAEHFAPAPGPRVLAGEVRRIEGEWALVTDGDPQGVGVVLHTQERVGRGDQPAVT